MGPAVAVTLNDRLDYFGSTVNLTRGWSTWPTSGRA